MTSTPVAFPSARPPLVQPKPALDLGLKLPVGMIAAVGEGGVIGRDGDLPWRLPSDLKYFKAQTLGKPIIMGRKQYQSVGKPLPGRDNIILTRDPNFRAEGSFVVPDLAAALRLADTLAAKANADELMIIGGGEIYRLAMPYASRLYITEVHLAPDGDVTFPVIDPADWLEVHRTPLVIGPNDEASATQVVLERKGANKQ